MSHAEMIVLEVMREKLNPKRRATLRSLAEYHEDQYRRRQQDQRRRVEIRRGELGIPDAQEDHANFQHHRDWAATLRGLLAEAEIQETSDE